ncbi:hypothetical protein [Propionicicella superfundia]|uniref:hypothetical protein n=1 Tax=Propionicicella superfundia TaxID=348582 RepID=UPI0012EB3905|nr:hypothetical protein [Propionicicella superfundia]
MTDASSTGEGPASGRRAIPATPVRRRGLPAAVGVGAVGGTGLLFPGPGGGNGGVAVPLSGDSPPVPGPSARATTLAGASSPVPPISTASRDAARSLIPARVADAVDPNQSADQAPAGRAPTGPPLLCDDPGHR